MKKVLPWLGCLLLIASAAVALVLLNEYRFSNPFLSEFSFDYPVYASGDDNGNIYVIDTSLRRISRINQNGSLGYVIHGGVRDGSSFFYANQLAVSPDGLLFVIDELRDGKGFYVLNERLLMYNAEGQLLTVLHEIHHGEDIHDPTLVQRGRIISMEYAGQGRLNLAVLDDSGIHITELSFDESGVSQDVSSRELEFYPLEQALLYVADVSLAPAVPVASLKNGRIIELNSSGNHRVLFDASSEANEPGIVPWELDAGPDGKLYFIDLEARALLDLQTDVILNRDLVAESAAYPDLYSYDYYRFDVGSDGTIYLPVDEGIVIRHPGMQPSFISSAAIPFHLAIQSAAWWLAAAAAVVASVLLLWLIYVRLMHRRIPAVLANAFAVVVLVAMVGGLSTFLLIDNFNSRYTDVIFDRISQMIQVFPLVIDGDAMQSIDSLDDFGSQSYMEIRNDLLDAFNENRDEWNKGYYFALYRILDDRLYGFMYMNGGIGMYHPFDWLMGETDPGVYDLAQQGQIASEMITDISGDWIYGVGPIFNSRGDVVGLFETGTDLYALELENQRLVRELIWELVTLWVVLMLLLVEITVLNNLMQERKHARIPLSDVDTGFSDGNLARPLVFLYFTAVSFSIAFLPLLSRDLYVPLAGMSRDFAIALPLSLEMAFFGIATGFTGFITRRTGWKPVFGVSLLVSAGGLLASALSPTLPLFMAARALTGLGTGMGYISMRSFVNLEGRRDKRTAAYSNFYSGMIAGINVGLVLGASLAGILGYSNVFFIGFALLLVTAVVFVTLYRQTPFFWTAPTLSRVGDRAAIMALLKSPRLWMYYILMILPTYIAASYISFYFPLFAAEQGLSTPEIGRLLIMNGLLIVYLGPPLSRFVSRHFGARLGSILGSIFWGLALVLAGISGDIISAAFVLMLMGLTEGFAVSAQNDLFFKEPTVNLVGEDRAIGYFELVGKIGETHGPMIFALVLLLGHQNGLVFLGTLVAALVIPYAIFVRKAEKLTEKQ